eukprot:SAG11_NODE_28840_length_317_cov_0.866972_1_plen_79_part_01
MRVDDKCHRVYYLRVKAAGQQLLTPPLPPPRNAMLQRRKQENSDGVSTKGSSAVTGSGSASEAQYVARRITQPIMRACD